MCVETANKLPRRTCSDLGPYFGVNCGLGWRSRCLDSGRDETGLEIRETFLSYFERRGHLRLPSASLVPAPDDTSTLLTVAGMQPLKPYFEGREEPPKRRHLTLIAALVPDR